MVEHKNKYNRALTFVDLVFAGYGFIIGAGIFTLMPYIMGYSKGYSWGAFVLGFIISILTGLSFARLNYEYPQNEAEYSWIMNILTDTNKPKTSWRNRLVSYFANIVIYAVVLLTVLGGATIITGMKDIIEAYKFGINNYVLCFILILVPTLVNIIGTKYTKTFNKASMSIITLAFLSIGAIALKYNKNFNDNKFFTGNRKATMPGIFRGAFISIFAFNGFQSVVQLSEEAKNREDIPKGIVASVSISTVLYLIVTISIISILGLKKASNSVYPFAEAFSAVAGKRGVDIVNILAILCMISTMFMKVFSSSRLLQKLSVLKLAPSYLQKLVPANKLFESFSSNKVNNEVNNEPKSTFETMPIYAIITYFVAVCILVVLGKGILEKLASGSNVMIFFIYTAVNLLCILNHHKSKDKVDKEVMNNMPGFLKSYPWYSILGTIITFIFLILSPKFISDIKPRAPP
jgi:basic amino acid/polyamine antiporter, APA family